MLRSLPRELWAFDAEWVPDPRSGRVVLALPDALDDDAVVTEMWRDGGATADNPRPYLKTVLCRVVSIAFVRRRMADDGSVTLSLHSLPAIDGDGNGGMGSDERTLLERFLGQLGERGPQLVGFNSCAADVPILLQRALAHGLSVPGFAHRPNKPWEGMDYFTTQGNAHVDLRESVSMRGRGPSLHELATVCGIPGKLGVDGTQVIDLWRGGDVKTIVQYNETDAVTTYLLWLRAALLAGLLSIQGHADEQMKLEQLLADRARDPRNGHLVQYLEEWRKLRGARS